MDLKYPPTSFTGVGLILWYRGVGLLLLYIEFELWIVNRSSRDFIKKYEGILELSIKQFLTQPSPTSLGQVMCDVWKMLMLLVTKLDIFCIELEGYAGLSQIQFCLKGKYKSKSVSERVVQVISR